MYNFLVFLRFCTLTMAAVCPSWKKYLIKFQKKKLSPKNFEIRLSSCCYWINNILKLGLINFFRVNYCLEILEFLELLLLRIFLIFTFLRWMNSYQKQITQNFNHKAFVGKNQVSKHKNHHNWLAKSTYFSKQHRDRVFSL